MRTCQHVPFPGSRAPEPSRAASGPAAEPCDDVALHVDAGGSLDEEVCQNEVVAWEDLASVDSIVIEAHRARSNAVLLLPSANLSPRDSIRQNRSSDNWILVVVN